ncbi:MAG: asparagine synthetase B, partial [Pirellulaceae bacterium]
MCGIVGGVWHHPDRALSRGQLESMMRRVVHRGPDDEGAWIQTLGGTRVEPVQSHPANPGVAFGFRRLSIIDLAGGHQPITNEDGSIQLIFNG